MEKARVRGLHIPAQCPKLPRKPRVSTSARSNIIKGNRELLNREQETGTACDEGFKPRLREV
jgi:hypothetical protein